MKVEHLEHHLGILRMNAKPNVVKWMDAKVSDIVLTAKNVSLRIRKYQNPVQKNPTMVAIPSIKIVKMVSYSIHMSYQNAHKTFLVM